MLSISWNVSKWRIFINLFALFKRNRHHVAYVSLTFRVLTSVILKRAQYNHNPLTSMLFCIVFPAVCLLRLVITLQNVLNLDLVDDKLKLNAWLRHCTPIVPMLFIYSKGDKLVSSDRYDLFLLRVYIFLVHIFRIILKLAFVCFNIF